MSKRLESVQANIRRNCSYEEDTESLKSTVLDLQCRSRKNNLIFTALHEVNNEHTEDLLRYFLYSELGIDYKIEFGNAHRFGRNSWGRRPIVARFLYFADLQYILYNAYKLRNIPFGIKQPFPWEIENRRKQLYSIQRDAKRRGKRMTLVRDRLYINNELFIVPRKTILMRWKKTRPRLVRRIWKMTLYHIDTLIVPIVDHQNDRGEVHRHRRNTKGAVGRMTMTIHFLI